MVVGGTLSVVLCLPIAGIFLVGRLTPMMGTSGAFWTAALGVLGATVVLGWMLWRILVRPITDLQSRAAGLQTGAAEAVAPLEHYGTAEMYATGRAMLDMGRALQNREAVLRGYADHVTHELKSPLTVVRGAAELLSMGDLPQAERERLIGRIEGAADRMTALLDAQRRLARAQEPAAPGEARLSDVADGMDLCDVTQDGLVPLPEDTLALVLDHLVSNARAHGATRVTLSYDGTLMTVQDDGAGVSAGNRERIFEPFFTTRRETGGTGMGLSILRRVLEAHEAEISLAESESGARFVIRFDMGA